MRKRKKRGGYNRSPHAIIVSALVEKIDVPVSGNDVPVEMLGTAFSKLF
jgi:hypothetical protein